MANKKNFYGLFDYFERGRTGIWATCPFRHWFLKLKVLLVFIFLIACQPTNTTVGKSIKKGTASNSDLQQLRITDNNGQPLSGTETQINVGDTLRLRANLYSLDDVFIRTAAVRWILKSISGSITSGLSCGSAATEECSFTPIAPGTIYIETLLLDQGSRLVSYTSATHPIVVSAPTVLSQLELTSGHLQNATVQSILPQNLKVTVKDTFGRGVSGVEVTFTVTAGGGSVLTSNPHVTDSDGVAQAQVQLGTQTGIQNFRAEVVGQSSLTQTFTATAWPGVPVSLEFLTPPAATYASLPLSQQPTVVAKDAFANIVTTLTSPLVVSVATGNGTITGSVSKNFNNGSVIFTDLAYSLAESNVSLRFTTGTLQLVTSALNFVSPSGATDITPADVDFGYVVTHLAGVAGRSTSVSVTVGSLSQPMSVSVSGSGNPQLRLNGGQEVGALTNVVNTNTLQVVADAPTVHGTVNVIQVYMGGRTETFEVRYADPNSVAYVFVSSTVSTGPNVSDSNCTNLASAAGYGGSWKVMAATTTTPLKNKIPYQWGQLRRLDGQLVANDWNQLWTGSLLSAMNLDENSNSRNTTVYTGVSDLTDTSTNDATCCSNWTLPGPNGYFGNSAATSTDWMNITYTNCGQTKAIYCISDPVGVQDTTPEAVTFTEMVTTTATQRMTTPSVTIKGVTTLISVSITASSGNPKIKINGGAEVTTGTVGNGDQVQLVMSAPTVTGQKNTATVTLGSITTDWWVGLADSQKIAAVFVSSTSYNGNLGGVSGANNTCTTLATAQGYSGQWKAILNTDLTRAQDNISWNWSQMRRLDGVTVATSWSDLWDGSIQNPINITETLATRNTNVLYGSTPTQPNHCYRFSSTSGGAASATYGDTSSTLGWIDSGSAQCGTSSALYCVSDPSGAADTTPNPIHIPMLVSYVSGATLDFTEVTVLGITAPITVAVTGTLGSPVLKINGIDATNNTGTVNMGDKIKVSIIAPTVLGTTFTPTLQVGPDYYTLKIGYADSSKIARVFVSSQTIGLASGLTYMDNQCTSAAETAGWGGTWQAMASTATLNVSDHISWNWGTLKRLDGLNVATSWIDLWDGSIQNPINVDENLTASIAVYVATGSRTDGTPNTYTRNSWSGGATNSSMGYSNLTNASWIQSTNTGTSAAFNLYCIENVDAPADTLPSVVNIPYKVFQELNTAVSSEPFIVKGVSAGVNFSLTDLSPGGLGNASYSVNGGGSVLAGTPSTVYNGDSIVLTMTSPNAANSSHKATFTVGSSGAIPWRVWTKGVTSGTLIKRIFVSDTHTGNLGGLAGADTICQSEATAASRGGTWKALISGEKTDENNWAINRVGYNWTEIWTMNGAGTPSQRVLSAPNLWNNSDLESLPNTDENGSAVVTIAHSVTNTDRYGFAKNSGAGTCNVWTTQASGTGLLSTLGQFNSSLSNSFWIDSNSTQDCQNNSFRVYCVEQ